MCTYYYFTFDDLYILGGFGKQVHIKGVKTTYNQTKMPEIMVGVSYKDSDFPKHIDENCILSIDRKLFQKMQNKWLDEKIDYCERWNHYCGVGGIVYLEEEDVKELDTWELNDYELDENGESVETTHKASLLEVSSWNGHVDIEHG